MLCWNLNLHSISENVAQFTGGGCNEIEENREGKKLFGLSETCAFQNHKTWLHWKISLSLSFILFLCFTYDTHLDIYGNSCLIHNGIGSLSMIFTCSILPLLQPTNYNLLLPLTAVFCVVVNFSLIVTTDAFSLYMRLWRRIFTQNESRRIIRVKKKRLTKLFIII